MGDFKQGRDKRFGGGHGGGFGRRDEGRQSFGGSGDRDRGPVTMHQATCAECGSSCEVPFRPVDGRPVYCANCFQSKRETGGDRGQDRFPRRDFGANKTFAKPDFSGNAGQGSNNELKKQLEMLNAKMDRLIKAVEAMAYTKPLVADVIVKETPKPVVKEAAKEAAKDVLAAKIKKVAAKAEIKVSKKKKK